MAQKLHSFGADSNMLKPLKATSLLHFSLWYVTQQALHTHAKPAKIRSRLQRLWNLCCTRPQEEYGPQKNHCPSELKEGGIEGSKDPPYFPCSIACGTFIPCHCIRREIAPQGRQLINDNIFFLIVQALLEEQQRILYNTNLLPQF